MKRFVLPALLTLTTLVAAPSVFGQNAAIDKAMQEEVKKAKEKSDKDITSDKSKDKAKTWFDRAKAYEDVALRNPSLDSAAALVAYEAYKKAVELDTKEGKAGKIAKEAQTALEAGAGTNLYVALMQQGAAKYQAKNLKGALQLMQTAMMVNPKDSTAALYTGIVAQQLDNPKLARESFEKYLTAGGKDPAIFYAVSNGYRTEKNFEKALEFLDKGIAANPGNKDLKSEKINVFLTSGKSDEAINNLKQMVAADPNNVQNVLILAGLYDNAALHAGDELQKLSGQLKRGSQIQKNIDDIKDKQGVFAAEKKRLQAALAKQPKNAELKRQLADVTQKEAGFKTQLDQAQQELKEYQASQQGADLEGMKKRVEELTAKQAQQKGLAQETYTKALQVDPANYDANYNMGVFYFNEGVEVKKRVDAMDMQTYQKEGKNVEQEAVVKFKQAMPYFEKAYEVKQDEEVKGNLKNVYNILKSYEKTDAYDAKLQKVSQ
jgi:predicted Zn-dependent protease